MKHFKNILVQVDTRRDEQALLTRAAELAKSHGAKLKIVDVVPEFSWPVRLAAMAGYTVTVMTGTEAARVTEP